MTRQIIFVIKVNNHNLFLLFINFFVRSYFPYYPNFWHTDTKQEVFLILLKYLYLVEIKNKRQSYLSIGRRVNLIDSKWISNHFGLVLKAARIKETVKTF